MKNALFALCFALTAGASTYLILEKGANQLAYYSSDGKLLGVVPVGTHPHEFAFSPDHKLLYTTDNGTMRVENPGEGGNSLSVIDIAARRKIANITLGKFRRPHGIDVDGKSGRIVVTTELPDQLILIDPATRGILRAYPTNGKTSHMVTLGPGAEWAYVSNGGSANVSAIHLKTGEVKLIPTGKRPEGSVLSRDGKELYVCNRDEAMITVIDTASNSARAVIRTGKGPVRIAITPDGNRLIYATMFDRRIGIADPYTRRELEYVLLTGDPVSLHLSADGVHAFASAEDQGTVFVVNLKTRHIEQVINTAKGAGPDPVVEVGN